MVSQQEKRSRKTTADGYIEKKSPTIVELLVEIVGVEPTTPCLQSRCSSQLSYTPMLGSPEQT